MRHKSEAGKSRVRIGRPKRYAPHLYSSVRTLSSRRTWMGLEEMSKDIWAKDYIEKIGKGQLKSVRRSYLAEN